jgi:adenosylmethionine-8-amino-7-oxononanoate aminotransferase
MVESQTGHRNSAIRDIASTLHPYTNLKLHELEGPLVIAEGDGVFVRGEDGKMYLEGLAGLWCASLGFSERRLADAAYRQLLKLPFYHTFAHKATDIGIELAEMTPKRKHSVIWRKCAGKSSSPTSTDGTAYRPPGPSTAISTCSSAGLSIVSIRC